MYLFNIRPEIVNASCDGAGDVPQPHLLLFLLAFLHLLLFSMVTCTGAHKLQTKMKFNSKSKPADELHLALIHLAKWCVQSHSHNLNYLIHF